jgi:hypothetical protein
MGAAVAALQDGTPWQDAAIVALQAALGSVGVHHVIRRVVPTGSGKPPAATAVLLALLVGGCGLVGGDPQTARDAYVDCVAERVEPELRGLLAQAVVECPADGRCEALEAAALERLEEIAVQCAAEGLVRSGAGR